MNVYFSKQYSKQVDTLILKPRINLPTIDIWPQATQLINLLFKTVPSVEILK